MSGSEDSKKLKFWYSLLRNLDRPEALAGFIRRVKEARRRLACGRVLGAGGPRTFYPPERPVEEEARERLGREKLHVRSEIARLEKLAMAERTSVTAAKSQPQNGAKSRGAPLNPEVQGRLPEIKQLRADNKSWGQVRNIMNKKHKLNLSKSAYRNLLERAR